MVPRPPTRIAYLAIGSHVLLGTNFGWFGRHRSLLPPGTFHPVLQEYHYIQYIHTMTWHTWHTCTMCAHTCMCTVLPGTGKTLSIYFPLQQHSATYFVCVFIYFLIFSNHTCSPTNTIFGVDFGKNQKTSKMFPKKYILYCCMIEKIFLFRKQKVK